MKRNFKCVSCGGPGTRTGRCLFKVCSAVEQRAAREAPRKRKKPRRPESPQLMKCGCRSSGVTETGAEVCTVHAPAPAAYRVALLPDLTGRLAKCSNCATTRPSDLGLSFFRMSDAGDERCQVCGSSKTWHRHPTMAPKHGAFVPSGIIPPDSFYCGCRGWN